MKELEFKKWLNEDGTSTACVANFAVPTISFMTFSKLVQKKKKHKKSKKR